MNKKKSLKDINIVIYFNNIRGLKVLEYLKKKKLNIKKIILSKKYLNKGILTKIKKTNISYSIINSLKTKTNVNLIKKNDLAIVAGFPYIFDQKHIKNSRLGILNCHAGLLPKYRGGSPLNWQLINNEKFFGISVIKINNKIDTGDIISEKKFLLKKNYNIKNLHEIANKNFPSAIYVSIKKILKYKKFKKQPIKSLNYFPQRKPKDSFLNFKKMKFIDLACFVRALEPLYPNAYIFFKKKKILIKSVQKSKKKVIIKMKYY